MKLIPSAVYNNKLVTGAISSSKEQEVVVKEFDNFYFEFTTSNTRFRLFKKTQVTGIYLWGDVGRGKTFLIDLLYDCLPTDKKLRLHYHRFMFRVHQELKQLQTQQQSNPLKKIAKKLSQETRVIFFDEFFVKDITDAMLLGNLLKYLLKYGVTFVMTSNIPPKDLYKNGLQRASFIPAIKLIEKNMKVLHLASDIDYRMRALELVEIFHTPADDDSINKVRDYFEKLAPVAVSENKIITILGRVIDVIALADDVVWFDFHAICDGPRSQNDYIEIASCYHTVFITGVPLFNTKKEEQARRFIALVDEFYDHNVKLILTAESNLDKIYQGQALQFEFQRTISRLTHMQTKEYLGLAHKS